MRSTILKIFPVILMLLVFDLEAAEADKVCLKISGSKITRKFVKSNKKCARGYTEIVDTAKLTGPTGAPGLNGTNGSNGLNGSSTSDFVWGTGADGDVTLTGTTTIDPLKQYGNISISTGAVVTVPSGSSIRCSGTLTVAGTLVSNSGGAGGKIEGFDGGTTNAQVREAKSFLNYSPAPAGEIVINNNGLLAGVVGAGGLNQTPPSDTDSLKNTFKVGVIAGSGGGGALNGEGGQGGGSFALLCKQGIAITATGVINADGLSGSSGGGAGSGGLVVLASNGTVNNQGSIHANGGNGGGPFNTLGAGAAGGGGGSGGIINIVGASILSSGTLSVTGGNGGSAGSSINGFYVSGGGAGGSLGGIGGDGGNFDATADTSTAGQTGGSGQVFQTTVTGADVAALLL